MKPIVESQILVNLPITNGSETYRYWKDPPVHPTMFMYFFNLTNKQEFLDGKYSKSVAGIIQNYVSELFTITVFLLQF